MVLIVGQGVLTRMVLLDKLLLVLHFQQLLLIRAARCRGPSGAATAHHSPLARNRGEVRVEMERRAKEIVKARYTPSPGVGLLMAATA